MPSPRPRPSPRTRSDGRPLRPSSVPSHRSASLTWRWRCRGGEQGRAHHPAVALAARPATKRMSRGMSCRGLPHTPHERLPAAAAAPREPFYPSLPALLGPRRHEHMSAPAGGLSCPFSCRFAWPHVLLFVYTPCPLSSPSPCTILPALPPLPGQPSVTPAMPSSDLGALLKQDCPHLACGPHLSFGPLPLRHWLGALHPAWNLMPWPPSLQLLASAINLSLSCTFSVGAAGRHAVSYPVRITAQSIRLPRYEGQAAAVVS